jgi:hypothetical protein
VQRPRDLLQDLDDREQVLALVFQLLDPGLEPLHIFLRDGRDGHGSPG